MIKKNTYIQPADECGVFWVSVFHLYYGFNRKTAFCGNFVKVSIRSIDPESWMRKKAKLKSIIVRVKKEFLKRDGSWVIYDQNNAVLLKKRLTPHGKRLTGPINSNIKRRKFRNSFSGVV